MIRYTLYMTAAVDHLANRSGTHVDLLRTLTDDELREQATWYRDQASTTATYPAHRYRNLAQTVDLILNERTGHGLTLADYERINAEEDQED